MAYWDRITQRGKVEDRRSYKPAVIGGIGLGGLAVLFLVNYLLGGSATDVLTYLEDIPVQTQTEIPSEEFAGEDEYEVFASRVLGSNNAAWSQIFEDMNRQYTPPKLVLFRQATESECGISSSRVGPYYCALDQTIYLDETFFDELTARFGARGGDVAEAYVISHEAGHHVQNLLGLMDQPRDSADSIRLELQADCFAGLWANSIKDSGVLLPDEIEEAMDAAAAVGDDRIQEAVAGYVNPENWTHGSSEQRVASFNKGYLTGELTSCSTLN